MLLNKRQKIVQEQFLNNEEAVIKRLKSVYNQSLKDITKKSEELQESINSLTMATMSVEMDEQAKKQLQSMIQSKVYQKQYQDALKKQVSGILDNMQVEEFKTVAEYLNKCYEEGFLGTMYDLHGQGIPLIFPLDQEAMVRAVQTDAKLTTRKRYDDGTGKKVSLYEKLGEDVDLLKRKITAQVSRGIATGMSYKQVAQQLAGYTNIGFNNAVRIARTEGHRIQVQSGMDACYKAKEKGADVVKQWDSTLDSNTRESHQKVDGEIRELDEKFSNGLMFPGDPSGGAAEVVNCRCALLQRARWAMDEQELATLKERADYYGLDKSDNFKEFRKKYMKAVEGIEKTENVEYNGGIPKAWKKMNIAPDDALENANLNRNSKKEGYKNNCPNCVNAYEMRKRGFDVIAKPSGNNHHLNYHPEDAWENVAVMLAKGSGYDEIVETVKATGENSRFEIAITYNMPSNLGHVFVAENRKGKTVFIDPQSGKILEKKIFDNVKDGQTKYWRIDNAKPSDRCITSCESR